MRIAADSIEGAAALAARVRRAVVAEGRDPVDVFVLLDVETLVSETAAEELAQLDNWAGRVRTPQSLHYVGDVAGLNLLLGAAESAGLDGVTLVPLALPSGVKTLPATDSRTGATVRERLGLARPTNRFAAPERNSR